MKLSERLAQAVFGYKSPMGAARAVHRELVKHAIEVGHKPEIELAIWSPEEAARRGYSKAWTVVYEAGPYDWAINTSFNVTGQGFWTEPYNGHMLCFYKE